MERSSTVGQPEISRTVEPMLPPNPPVVLVTPVPKESLSERFLAWVGHANRWIIYVALAGAALLLGVLAWLYGAKRPLVTILGVQRAASEAGVRYAEARAKSAELAAQKAITDDHTALHLEDARKAHEQATALAAKAARTSGTLAAIGDDDAARAAAFNDRHGLRVASR